MPPVRSARDSAANVYSALETIYGDRQATTNSCILGSDTSRDFLFFSCTRPGGWHHSERLFLLSSIGAGLTVDTTFQTPQLQRLHDVNLMDAIHGSGQLTASEIRRLNYCRLYFKATTLSDIAQPNGRYLDLCKLNGDFSLFSSSTHGLNIHQEKPSEVEWRLWKKQTVSGALRQALSISP